MADRIKPEMQAELAQLQTRIQELEAQLQNATAAEAEAKSPADSRIFGIPAYDFLDNLNEGCSVLDGEWRYIYVNRVGEAMARLPRTQITGRSIWDLFPSLRGGLVQQEFERIVRERKPANFEYYFAPHEFWVEVDAQPTAEGLIFFVRDISRRKETERALRDSEERSRRNLAELEQIYQTAPIGITFIDTSLRYVRINNFLAELNGLPIEAHLGRTIEEVLPDIALSAVPLYRQVFDSGQPLLDQEVIGETPLQPGVQRRFLSSYHPVKDARGVMLGVVAVVQDTTERQRAEQALRDSEALLRLVINCVPGLVSYIDRDYRYRFTNGGYVEWFGRPNSDFDHRTVAEAVGEEGFQLIKPLLDRSFEGAPVIFESQFTYRETDPPRSIRATYVPDHSPSGEVRGVVVLVEDISRQKLDEQALRSSNEELRRANAELEQFAFIASHDLQEPLRMVNSYAQLLVARFREDDTEAQELAQYIRMGVHRMRALIQDVLAYSRALHTVERPIGRANLWECVNDAIMVLKGSIEETGAEIMRDHLPVVEGDRGQLSQVFQNLISNALKYRKPHQQPMVRISAQRQKTEWLIAFQDNGIGFEMQYAERIFGLFKRLHQQDYPGNGLGLAICRRIIERHGGRIWAESEPDEGATFYFTLPVQ